MHWVIVVYYAVNNLVFVIRDAAQASGNNHDIASPEHLQHFRSSVAIPFDDCIEKVWTSFDMGAIKAYEMYTS